ncbi:Uncharacterised protein [Vibrio cholerae]|nr:Uncharacterised protein [Vibrio cholerae]
MTFVVFLLGARMAEQSLVSRCPLGPWCAGQS